MVQASPKSRTGLGWYQLSVVEQILQFARLDTGGDALNVTEVGVNSLVTEVVEIVGQLEHEKKVVLTTDLLNADVLVPSDAGRLTQTLANLLTNAHGFPRHFRQ